jgi:FeS assembly protein IscX
VALKWLVCFLLAVELLLVVRVLAQARSSDLTLLLLAGNSMLLIWCALQLREHLPVVADDCGGTMIELNWGDSEDIGIELYEKFPETDPLTVRFTELHRMVVELKGFSDDAQASSEPKLEAIQMAWYEEWKENQ